MEESLNKPNFNPIAWLNANIDMNRAESLETQLTELTFNLQNYQSELESVIISSKEAMEKFVDTLDLEIESITDEYDYINQFIKMNFGELELQKMRTNDALFDEISEKNTYRTRITNTLSIFEQIISLDFHLKEVKDLLDQMDILALEKKILSIQKPIAVIMKLSAINPLYEKIEKLIETIDAKLKITLAKKLSKDDVKLDPLVLPIYRIYKMLNKENYFLVIYEEERLTPKLKSFTSEISPLSDLREIGSVIVKYFQIETEYMKDLIQNKSITFFVHALKLFISKILPVFTEEIFNPQYLNSNPESILDIFGSYLELIAKIEEICETFISDADNLNQILGLLYGPVIAMRKQVVQNEIKFLEKELSRIISDFDFREGYADKLSSFDFLNAIDSLNQSFERVFEISFGFESERWSKEAQRIIEDYISKFIMIIQEVDAKLLKNEFLEKILIGPQVKLGARWKEKNQTSVIEKMDFNFSQFKSLLDVLIKKFEDFAIFEDKVTKLDFKVRSCLLENTFSSQKFKKILINIQKYILKTEEDENENKRAFFLAIQNGLILFDGCLKDLKNVQEQAKKTILKIMIAESYNKLVDLPKDKAWTLVPNPDVEQPKIQFFNPSEFVLPLSQNFFAHLQFLEEISANRSKQALQGNESYLQEIYTKKLENEYQTENLSFEKKSEIEEKVNLVKYWAFHFSNNLLKIYHNILQTIEICTYMGLHQLKSDIEYLMGVFQSFRFMGKITEFDHLLKIIESSKPTDKVILKELL